LNAPDKQLVDRNLGLAKDFLLEGLSNPSVFDAVPDGVTVVLVPDDDADLAAANVAGAVDAFQRGEDVLLRHVRSLVSTTTLP
jgi:hypothetical protein